MWAITWFMKILLYGSVLTHPYVDIQVTGPLEDSENDDIYLGQRTAHKVSLDFAGQTVQNLEIEIMSSDDTNFILGAEPTVSIGDDVNATVMVNGEPLAITETTYFYFMEKKYEGDFKDPDLAIRHETGFILTLGNISAPSSNTSSSTKVDIEMEFYYHTYTQQVEGFFSTFAVEYNMNNESYLILSQIQYTLQPTTNPITVDEAFDVETIPDPIRGLPLINLFINLPFVLSNLQVQVSVKNEDLYKDKIVVSEMRLAVVGHSFKSVAKERIYSKAYSECPLTSSLVLDCGLLFNKDATNNPENDDRNLLVVETILQTLDTDLNGTDIEFVIGIHVEKVAIWFGELNLTVNLAPRALDVFSTFTTNVNENYKVVSPGFQGIVEITLTIPEFTRNNYTFSFISTSTKGKDNALSILGMVLNTAGNNIDCDTRTMSNIKLELAESKPGSGLYNSGSVTLTIENVNVEMKPTEELNRVKFNLYVMMLETAKPGDVHRLLIDINDVGGQTADFTVGADKSYSQFPLYKDELQTDCSTQTYLPDTIMSVSFDVTTFRNTVVSPVTYRTAVPSAGMHLLEVVSAEVIFRGRNVGCVNVGNITTKVVEWVDTDSDLGGTFLYLPLVCNVEVVDDPKEDTFVIALKLHILNLEELRASDMNNHLFITHRETFSDKDTFLDRFNTKTSIDFSKTRRVDKLKIPNSMHKYIDANNFLFKLQWSEDNVEFHDYSHTWGKGVNVTDALVFKTDRPLYARYVRLVYESNGCTLQYEPEQADFGKDIDFYGKDFSKNTMLENVMYVLDDDDNTCKQLPNKTTTETVTYYWSHFKTNIWNTDGVTAFTVKLTGRGISCDNKLGRQVTKVMYPKNAATSNFSGSWKKCTFLERVEGDPMSCMYKCPCSDAISCAAISVLLYYDGEPTEPFELCGVKIIQ
ncbi:uncharacterized protein LOC132714288 [Ruditapes philippinarum]|uniref:uncharacterized protein LOC132714288 n=1 Tax=Ruditapes philippinarum TaxID=129788 RepID=UPI00295AC6CB|nr:uncharacterized protein LOC132714288 [Ruditapes philippinarum]